MPFSPATQELCGLGQVIRSLTSHLSLPNGTIVVSVWDRIGKCLARASYSVKGVCALGKVVTQKLTSPCFPSCDCQRGVWCQKVLSHSKTTNRMFCSAFILCSEWWKKNTTSAKEEMGQSRRPNLSQQNPCLKRNLDNLCMGLTS